MIMPYAYKIISSPIGQLKLIASDKGLRAILWGHALSDDDQHTPQIHAANHPLLQKTAALLNDYFAGKQPAFRELPLDVQGTSFQRSVWEAMRSIPYGETRSYSQIAQQIHRPKAARAVGAASGQNPTPIIAPCHRVIGANGKLTGFAGGLKTKAFLLALERSL